MFRTLTWDREEPKESDNMLFEQADVKEKFENGENSRRRLFGKQHCKAGLRILG